MGTASSCYDICQLHMMRSSFLATLSYNLVTIVKTLLIPLWKCPVTADVVMFYEYITMDIYIQQIMVTRVTLGTFTDPGLTQPTSLCLICYFLLCISWVLSGLINPTCPTEQVDIITYSFCHIFTCPITFYTVLCSQVLLPFSVIDLWREHIYDSTK